MPEIVAWEYACQCTMPGCKWVHAGIVFKESEGARLAESALRAHLLAVHKITEPRLRRDIDRSTLPDGHPLKVQRDG